MQGHNLNSHRRPQHRTTDPAVQHHAPTKPTAPHESDPRRALRHGPISCLHHKAGRRRTMAHGLHMQRATIIGVRQFRVPDPSSQRTIDRTDAGNCSRPRTHSDHRRHRPSALMADVASSYCRARKLAAGGAETTTPTTARRINAAAKHVKSSEQKEEEKKHTARRHPYQPEEGNRLGRS